MGRVMKRVWMVLAAVCLIVLLESPFLVSAEESDSDLKDTSFEMYDLRTPDTTVNFDGGDGQYSIIVFGGIGTCGNTNVVLRSLGELAGESGIESVNIYVFDIKGNTDEFIVSKLDSFGISESICVNSVRNSQEFYNLYSKCYFAALDEGIIEGSYNNVPDYI